jgi:predicted transcriptional regulator
VNKAGSNRFCIVVTYNSTGCGIIDDTSTSTDSTSDQQAGESAHRRVFTRHKVGEALSKAGFDDVIVLSHEAADRVLTPARREIIVTLDAHDVGSLRELAGIVGRDPGNLSRDMQILVEEDIVRYVGNGSSKRPELKHDTIISEPVMTV